MTESITKKIPLFPANEDETDLDQIMRSGEIKEREEKEEEELSDDPVLSDKIAREISITSGHRSGRDLYELHERFLKGDSTGLKIQPEFQRGRVWDPKRKERFIDSIIRGFPIPNLCLGFDHHTQETVVIDGLQRIATIIEFLDTENKIKVWEKDGKNEEDEGKYVRWKFGKQKGIINTLHNKALDQMPDKILNQVRDAGFPISIVRYHSNKEYHEDYIQTLFRRLNTGGRALSTQEIRNGAYGGTFNQLLLDLRKSKTFQKIWEIKNNERFKWEELILRFFALEEKWESYRGALNEFLNQYMRQHRKSEESWLEEKRRLFEETLHVLLDLLPEKEREKSRPKVIWDGLLIGIAKNLRSLQECKKIEKNARWERFSEHAQELRRRGYFIEGTAATDKVKKRIEAAIEKLGP